MGMAQGRGFPVGGVFAAALDAVVVMDHEGRITDFNPAAERTFGHGRDDVVGRELAAVMIPPELRESHREALARFVATRTPRLLDQRLELVACRADGSRFPVELTITQVPDHEPPLFAGFIRDLTATREAESQRRELLARERLARAEAEQARGRSDFLAEIGFAFDHALDVDQALETLANLAVPVLGDLCVVDYVGEGRVVRAGAAVAATDLGYGRDVQRRRAQRGVDEVVRGVLNTREPTVVEDARALGYLSAIVVPLPARDRVLGAATFARVAPGGRPYDSADLVTMRELGRRAGLAIDNARLYEETRHIATALQASLLPPVLPTLPDIRVAGRYRAARPGQELGGDFYDVFPVDGGRWVIAIGDVCGKGPEAAALTALARYTIRAAAASGDPAPDRVLSVLNDALNRDPTADGRFLTAACALLRPGREVHALTLATAGHPSPLVVRADGAIEWARAPGSVLGIFADALLGAVEIELRVDDTFVLYTDGLTDAGAPGHALGEPDLVAAIEAARDGGPGRLVDALEEAALAAAGGRARDDIALLALANAPERRRRPRRDSRPLLRVA